MLVREIFSTACMVGRYCRLSNNTPTQLPSPWNPLLKLNGMEGLASSLHSQMNIIPHISAAIEVSGKTLIDFNKTRHVESASMKPMQDLIRWSWIRQHLNYQMGFFPTHCRCQQYGLCVSFSLLCLCTHL